MVHGNSSTSSEPSEPSISLPQAGSTMTEFDATKIAKICHMGTEHFEAQLESTEHRLAILSKWDIPKGSKVLELGCGQGDCTAVLAELVGPNGHVTAVDPGSLDYGSPYTLGQAQNNIFPLPLVVGLINH
ncbi:uncharacterized protein ARMOST_18387 [Armillaria ostoyae]|uniref:Methyltransferase domain-containing protein n=1 Tax=Armillaria ostoyae TaxID=47428 RepID=A0A284S1M6_ARMOS|nr:uncharacterized protein ARMOST_18387 [Armillaria ostoyae]